MPYIICGIVNMQNLGRVDAVIDNVNGIPLFTCEVRLVSVNIKT
jgi:hypothetical protein